MSRGCGVPSILSLEVLPYLQVTSAKIASAFANGMEYFNTYGGCTAAGAAGSAVLHILQEERLQQHAQRVGEHLIARLDALKQVGEERFALELVQIARWPLGGTEPAAACAAHGQAPPQARTDASNPDRTWACLGSRGDHVRLPRGVRALWVPKCMQSQTNLTAIIFPAGV